VAVVTVILLELTPAQAGDPLAPHALDPALREEANEGAVALVVGAATVFAGVAVGGTLVMTSSDSRHANVGWGTLEASLVLAPLVAHGVAGEWGRGALFAAGPALTGAFSIPLFTNNVDLLAGPSIEEETILLGLLAGGIAAATVGIIDAALVDGRRLYVAPTFSVRQGGLVIGGVL